MKKFFSVALSVAMTATLLAGCGSSSSTTETKSAKETTAATETKAAGEAKDVKDLKIGVIYIGDENEGYTASHMAGIKEMAKELGLDSSQIIEKTNIPEDESCYDAAVDLADQGCTIVFGTSFGHEDYLKEAATEFPDVEFCHATGYQAAMSGLSNMHNYFDNIYEARYVSGVVAGLKLQDMIDNGDITAEEAKIGYVGAFPYAEVISRYTAFYMGAKSVVDSATMEVQYTNSWADSSLEAETATALISDGCVLISQHADTTGAPTACQSAGVPCVGYNVDMTSVAPDYALTSPTNNWSIYYKYAVESVMNGTAIETDWSKGFADNAVAITALGKACPEGTQAKVDETIAGIKSGAIHVFDTTKMTVGGKTLDEVVEAEGADGKYAKLVSDGYFHESEVTSAPAFDMVIDGITSK